MKKAMEIGVPKKVGKGYPVNMAHLYRLWFQWGFLTFVLSAALMISVLFLDMKKWLGKLRDFTLLSSMLVISCNGVIWLVLGGIWRFGNAGQVVSGDRLQKTDI